MEAAAIMLDTLDFSGFNTALQAVEQGLPYLAFEGQYMRGRLASSMFRLMDLPDLVATSYDDFAQKAVGLAADPIRLNQLSSDIRSRRHILFRDESPVRALESFLARQIQASREATSGARPA
jgi:predicted O-linked N-acetylglucosamine transferase (SPINDLY family)